MMIIRPYSPEFTFCYCCICLFEYLLLRQRKRGGGGAREEGCSSCKLQKYAETDRLLNLFAS